MILNAFKCDIVVVCFFIFATNVAVRSALVSDTIFKGLFNEDRSFHKRCAEDNDCKGNKQYCNTAIQLCECQPFFEYRYDTSNCSPCPIEGEECMSCCSNANLKCYFNVCTRCDDDFYECDNSQSVFMNASQIALVAALIMGAAALATLLYRICTKPSYFGRSRRRVRSSRNAEATESDFTRVARASLTSIQIRVISRLRDRPPKYETQHNYDMRLQRQEEEVQRTTNSNENIHRIPTLSEAHHAPPPYDGSKDSVHESPPPYSDTGHETLPDVIMANRSTTSQIGGTSQSNDNSTISIISNACPERNVITANSSISDDKEERTIHI